MADEQDTSYEEDESLFKSITGVDTKDFEKASGLTVPKFGTPAAPVKQATEKQKKQWSDYYGAKKGSMADAIIGGMGNVIYPLMDTAFGGETSAPPAPPGPDITDLPSITGGVGLTDYMKAPGQAMAQGMELGKGVASVSASVGRKGGRPSRIGGAVKDLEGALAGIGKGLDPTTALNEMFASKKGILEDVDESRRELAQGRAALRQGREAEDAAIRAQHEPLQREAAKNAAHHRSRVVETMERHKAAKLEPFRLWKQSPWAFIGAGLLGGLAQGLQAAGGISAPNQGLLAIQRAIEMDIQAQQADIEKLGTEMAMEKNLVGMFRAEGNDIKESMDAARVFMLDEYKSQMEEMAAMSNDIVVQQNAAMMKAELDVQKDGHLRKLQEDKYKKEFDIGKMKQADEHAKARNAIAWSQMNMQKKIAMAKGQQQQGKFYIGGLKRKPGLGDPDKQGHQKMRNFWLVHEQLVPLLSELNEWRRGEGAMISPDKWFTESAQARELLSAITLLRKRKDEMGAAFTEFEFSVMNLPRNAGEFGKWADAFDKKIDIITREKNVLLKTYGYEEEHPFAGFGSPAGR